MNPYPLTFEPILINKVWGGDRLRQFGKLVAPGGRVGESWEIADLPHTSASGAGGGGRHSLIRNGVLKSASLAKAIRAWGGDLLGASKLTRGGEFPLLVKLLDARQHLSVQVHPSPEYARANEDADLKTECWYVLAADRGERGEDPVLFKGFKPGVTPGQYEACIRAGGAGIEELMNAVPAIPGEMHDLPSGTIHALGAGVLVAEVQTPSDTTYRVFDWNAMYDRPQREMHHEQALASTIFDEPPPPTRADASGGVLVSNAFYTVRELRGDCEACPIPASGSCVGIMTTGGMGASLASTNGSFDEVDLPVGRTALIPAACVPETVLRAGPGTRALVASVS